jgi:hypothetical protein
MIDLPTRITRLDALIRGLRHECTLIRQRQDPLLYLKALAEAIGGLETARVVLAKARQRLTQ